jgi:hypothetical protein
MAKIQVFFACFFSFYLFQVAFGNYGDAFGLINKVQTECEQATLTVASKLADTYNSFDETVHGPDRLKDDYIMEHLGFEWALSVNEASIDAKTVHTLQQVR